MDFMGLISKEPFQSGLTWRSLLAVVYGICVFSPAFIWLSLVTIGAPLIRSVSFITLILSIELARLSGTSLTKQEGFIVFALSAGGASMMFLDLIYSEYFVQSDIAIRFGITPNIPTWWAPPVDSPVWALRTFFHPDWIIPLALRLSIMLLSTVGGIALGLFTREMYIEVERLPFPIQRLNVQAILTLVEREEKSMDVFNISTLLGLIYGILLYALPFSLSAMGISFQFLPIPWIDYNSEIERYLPGASLGIATDIGIMTAAFVIPTRTILGMFIGSFIVMFLGNWLIVYLTRTGIFITEWGRQWTYGMNIQRTLRDQTLYFWALPIIGIGLGAGLIPIIMRPGLLVRTIKALMHPAAAKPEERVSGKLYPAKLILPLYFAASLISILLIWRLVPGAPIWLLFFMIMAWPLLQTLISARMIGITGQGFATPNLSNILIYASGYSGYPLWFAPMPGLEGTGWVTEFKLCQFARTTIGSYVKTWVVAFVLQVFISFLFVQAFWSLAPIPSVIYPGVAINWPVQAAYQSLWVARPAGIFDITWLFYGALIAIGATLLLEVVHSPISMLSIAVGLGMPIPLMITMLIGVAVDQIFRRLRGDIWWNRYRMNIGAGIMMGEGIAVVLGAAIAIIVKATWILPY